MANNGMGLTFICLILCSLVCLGSSSYLRRDIGGVVGALANIDDVLNRELDVISRFVEPRFAESDRKNYTNQDAPCNMYGYLTFDKVVPLWKEVSTSIREFIPAKALKGANKEESRMMVYLSKEKANLLPKTGADVKFDGKKLTVDNFYNIMKPSGMCKSGLRSRGLKSLKDNLEKYCKNAIDSSPYPSGDKNAAMKEDQKVRKKCDGMLAYAVSWVDYLMGAEGAALPGPKPEPKKKVDKAAQMKAFLADQAKPKTKGPSLSDMIKAKKKKALEEAANKVDGAVKQGKEKVEKAVDK